MGGLEWFRDFGFRFQAPSTLHVRVPAGPKGLACAGRAGDTELSDESTVQIRSLAHSPAVQVTALATFSQNSLVFLADLQCPLNDALIYSGTVTSA